MNYTESSRINILKCSIAVSLMISITGCFGSNEKPLGPAVTLNAEFCIQGEATDAILYVKNLNDFEWGGIKISVVRRGTEYTWTKGAPEFMLPEADTAASPSTVPKDWINREPKHKFKVIRDSLRRMNFFNDLETGNIQITSPGPGVWSGEIIECESA